VFQVECRLWSPVNSGWYSIPRRSRSCFNVELCGTCLIYALVSFPFPRCFVSAFSSPRKLSGPFRQVSAHLSLLYSRLLSTLPSLVSPSLKVRNRLFSSRDDPLVRPPRRFSARSHSPQLPFFLFQLLLNDLGA